MICTRLIANIIWFIFGGFLLGLGWFLVGILCCITLIFIPVGMQCFKIAGFICLPFGKEIRYEDSGAVTFIVNIIWILLFGWELAIGAVCLGIFYCVTIIGIPIGIQSFKFAKLALMPFGARVRVNTTL